MSRGAKEYISCLNTHTHMTSFFSLLNKEKAFLSFLVIFELYIFQISGV